MDSTPAPASVEATPQQPVPTSEVSSNGHSELPNGHDESIQAIEQHVSGLSLGPQPEGELHRACAEGKLDEVRAVLSRSLDDLESLDMTTGCTPIVLAIRNNQPDVVRELLSAGAIVPPPGLTSDPLLLSILYPQPLYGMPQYMGGQMSMHHHHEYYAQPAFFPQDSQRMFPAFQPSSRKDGSPTGQGQGGPANLPPVEVAKTIPCRNFPNCKYGANCVFFHPRPQPGYYGAPMPNNGFMGTQHSNGFDPSYPAFANGMHPQAGPYFQPNFSSFQQQHHQQQPQQPPQHFPHQEQPQQAASHETQPASLDDQQTQEQNQTQQIDISDQSSDNIITQHDQTQQAQPIPTPNQPSSGLSAFVPSFQPGMTPLSIPLSPPALSQFGMSPLSPSMLGASLPSIPPAEAFFAAASPPNASVLPNGVPNGFVPGMNGHVRRQSFNNPAFGVPPKPFGHGKKPSFSGGPRPWPNRTSVPNGSSNLGSWKDGNPPPCAFFSQGKCRNGEFCKFPHLDAEGNDCRHPDVVRGLIPPLPSLSRQSRGMRMGNNYAPFDPAFRHQQHMAFVQRAGHMQPNGEFEENDFAQPPEANGDNGAAGNGVASTEASTPTSSISPETAEVSGRPVLPPSVPPKPVSASLPPIVRSASQPGVQRVHVNGMSSRSQSPAPSNVSLHGQGHPRRPASRNPAPAHVSGNVPNGTRSSSAGADVKLCQQHYQRVPGADEFPALAGLSERKENPAVNVKTAAQVLSQPAPPKPLGVKVSSANGDEEDSISGKSENDHSIVMDSEPDSDAVIVSRKPSSTATTPATNGSPAQRASLSFANIASNVSPTLETAPVGVKA